ncbi:MAG: NAD-dependent epimerase/dehydratase family protein [Acidobacteria bacterium]|nr:NAD-dependent epimerase/dehydratase family protein [Acidobacteriota bacterium]
MKTILVTGATGFLGRWLLETLREREPDARLRLLCRQERPELAGDSVEVVVGDVQRRDDVVRACMGVQQVYHLAGLVDRSPAGHWSQYELHVEGMRNVCEAMLEAGVDKGVYVSTSGVNAVGLEPAERNEESPYAQDVIHEWPYYLSKIYAEKLALWYCRHRKLPLTIVNPSLMLGPGDERRSSTQDVELFLKGQILVIPVGGLNLVDVRDAAQGCWLAMEKGRVGECYLLGGANLTFHEWILRAAKIAKVSPPKLMMPTWATILGARVLRKVMPWIGKSYDFSDDSIKMSAVYWYCDTTKAREELGFKTRDSNQTLRDTIEYLRSGA